MELGNEELVFRPSEVACLFGLSRNRIFDMRREGMIPSYRLGELILPTREPWVMKTQCDVRSII